MDSKLPPINVLGYLAIKVGTGREKGGGDYNPSIIFSLKVFCFINFKITSENPPNFWVQYSPISELKRSDLAPHIRNLPVSGEVSPGSIFALFWLLFLTRYRYFLHAKVKFWVDDFPSRISYHVYLRSYCIKRVLPRKRLMNLSSPWIIERSCSSTNLLRRENMTPVTNFWLRKTWTKF